MSWLDFLKRKNNTTNTSSVSVATNEVRKTTTFISFDRESLRVINLQGRHLESGSMVDNEEVLFLGNDTFTSADLTFMLERGINNLKHRIEGSLDVEVSLPLDSVFTKYLTIPRNNMADMVLQSEMKKIIPIPFNEVMFAYNKVRELGSQDAFFCIVIHKNLFDKYQTIFKNYGMQPYFELSFFSLARMVPEVGVFAVLWTSAVDSYLVFVKDKVVVDLYRFQSGAEYAQRLSVDMSIEIKDAYLLWNSFLDKTNSLNTATQDLLSAIAKSVNIECVRDILSAVENFNKDHQVPIEKIFISGKISARDIVDVARELSISLPETEQLSTSNSEGLNIDLSKYIHHFGLAKRDH